MNNPYLLAWALNIAVFGAVWIYVRHRFLLPFRVYVVVAATCMPVPILVAGLFFFLADVIGVALLAVYLLRRSRLPRESNNFASSVIGLYSVGLIAWPLVSTYFSVTRLNETARLGDVAFFVFRSAAQLGFFLWAARTGAAVRSVKPLLWIPAAFWLLFAVLGIMQFAGAIDVDAFWYLNSDYKSLQHLTSGFMGMDKPQLALWSGYVTCIALWLALTDSRAIGFAVLSVLVASVLIVLAIGSRQGLLGVGVAMVCTPSLVALKGMGRFRLMRLAVGLAAMLAVGPLVWNSIDAGRREWMLLQFEQLERITSMDELARQRDSSTPDLIRYIADRPHRLYFGSGVGTESGDGQNPQGIRTYAEGEYLRVLWSGGLLSLACYVGVLVILLRQSVRGLLCNFRFQRGEGALLSSMTIVGAFFAFGQFHLFTTMYHNVPCNYLLMITAGLLGGAVTRSCAASNCARVSGYRGGLAPIYARSDLPPNTARNTSLSSSCCPTNFSGSTC